MFLRPRLASGVASRLACTLMITAAALVLGSIGACVTPVPPGDDLPDCFSDADCAGDEVCTGGACVPVKECITNADCAEDEICVGGACVPLTTPLCTTGGDCAPGEACENGTCVPIVGGECTNDDDCDTGETCTAGACVVATGKDCTSSADCGIGEVCEGGACTLAPTPECTSNADCREGEVCRDGKCNQASSSAAEIGYTDPAGVYQEIKDGDNMPLFNMNQGGSHLYVTVRATGFPPPMEGVVGITLRQRVEVPELMEVPHDFTANLPFTPIEDGRIEFPRRFVFFAIRPFELDGKDAVVTFTLTAFDDPTISVVVERMVVLTAIDDAG